ncbi:hypothetical protein SAMN02927921_03282 [Sinomicrobium oceani]|uniref:Uncharacterized protein n=1 Tax=Sinomicrobium oceani TaxID=1150368 RepID=A0A1K1R863_9FLAO|nr:hypothetical protein [Sinomicrobium oceani]SFW68264.1 hypothetical protein SAMN02927921_03282 [Sinomicrobium oceani]
MKYLFTIVIVFLYGCNNSKKISVNSITFESHICFNKDSDILRFDDVHIIVNKVDTTIAKRDFFIVYDKDTISLIPPFSDENIINEDNLSFRFSKNKNLQENLVSNQFEIIDKIKKSSLFYMKGGNERILGKTRMSDLIEKDSIIVNFSYLDQDFIYMLKGNNIRRENHISKEVDCN